MFKGVFRHGGSDIGLRRVKRLADSLGAVFLQRMCLAGGAVCGWFAVKVASSAFFVYSYP